MKKKATLFSVPHLKKWHFEFTSGYKIFLSLILLSSFFMTNQASGQSNTNNSQWGKNGPASAPVSPVVWANGNAQAQNSHFVEGQSIPTRIELDGLTPLVQATVTFNINIVQGSDGEHAFDFFTGPNRIAEVVQPTDGLTGYGAPGFFTFPVPSAGNVTPGATVPGSYYDETAVKMQCQQTFDAAIDPHRNALWFYNCTVQSITYAWGNENGTSTQQTYATVTFTPIAGATKVLFALGCHIAAEGTTAGGCTGWGEGHGATNIGGSPYHFHIQEICQPPDDCVVLGSQDQQMAADAVCTPPVVDITGNNTICSGASTTLTAVPTPPGTYTYQWSTVSGGVATPIVGATNSTLNVSPTSTTTYRVAVHEGGNGGCDGIDEITVTVNNPPDCNILPGNQTICAGGSASFTATGGGTYLWSTGATSAIISNITANGTYSVTVTSAQGCTSTCSATLTRVDNPQCGILPGNQTICAGSTGSFTATGGTSYLWSTGATTAIISNLTAAGPYSVTVTSGSCKSSCSATLSFAPNASANAGADPAAQCRDASIVNNVLTFGTNTFSVTGTVLNGTPSWSVQAKSDAGYNVSIVSPNSLSTQVQVSGNVNGGTVTLRLTATSNTTPPCGNATDDVILTLIARPLLKELIGSDFCPNVTTTGSVSLLNSENGVSYQLQDDGQNNVQAAQDGNGGTLTWVGLPEGNYTVLGTRIGAADCTTRTDDAPVIENALDEVTITPVDQLCTDAGCVPLTATPSGGTFSGTGVISSDNQFCTTGLAPGQYTVTYTYTNTAGCTDSETTSINVVSCEAGLCTYTQGAFGNEGGNDCDGTTSMPTTDLINQSIANWGGTITIGCGTDVVTISTGQASCVIDKLPGGGKAVEFDLTAPVTICNIPASMLKNGRINNILFSQTLSLALNIGITSPSALSNFPLQAGTLYTADVVGGCGSDVPLLRICNYDPVSGLLTSVTNEYEQRSFSQALMDAIDDAGYPQTVGGLFGLASDALCNKDGIAGTEQGVDLSEIAGAAGSINEIFDECRISQGWDIPCAPTNTIAPPRIIVGASTETPGIQKLKVAAFPNPYTDNVRFVIESPVSGQAILEVYNITGQKVQTLFKGHMQANETRVVDYRPAVASGMLIYNLRIGTQVVTGKLVGLKH